ELAGPLAPRVVGVDLRARVERRSIRVRRVRVANEVLRIVPAVIARAGPRATRVLPLRLRGQAIRAVLLRAQPFAERDGVVPRDVPRRVVVLDVPAGRPGAECRRLDDLPLVAVARHRLAVLRVDDVTGVAAEREELTERHLATAHVER